MVYTYLVNGTGDEAPDVFVVSKDLWKGGAERWSSLHRWKRHLTYRGGQDDKHYVRVSQVGQDDKHYVRVSQVDLPMQSVSWKPKMPFAWFTVTHFCVRSTLR